MLCNVSPAREFLQNWFKHSCIRHRNDRGLAYDPHDGLAACRQATSDCEPQRVDSVQNCMVLQEESRRFIDDYGSLATVRMVCGHPSVSVQV